MENMGSITNPLVAVVTGSNTGIGYEIVKGLAKHGVETVLAARNVQSGLQAVKLLKEDGLSNVVFHQLDITSLDSINKFATWIKETYGYFDILVNNAGITAVGPGSDGYATVKSVIDTNFYGTKNVTEALLKCMKAGGRIINVSSSGGRIDVLASEEWKAKLTDSDQLTEELVDSFIEEYLENLGTESSLLRLPGGGYVISKISLNAYTRILSKRLMAENITVTATCPGETNTKMTSRGHDPATGADTAIWLATTPPSDFSSGEFYVNRTSVGFVEIPLMMFDKWILPLDDWLEHLRSLFHGHKEIN